MTHTKWNYAHSNQFKRDYKNLRNSKIEKRVEDAIVTIIESDNPRMCGIHKVSNMDCIYGFEIGSHYRILYEVFDQRENREVLF